MTAHAPTVDATTIAARVAQLPHLSMDSLWALWDEYFEERPKHHHRTWLESRLAYRIQERAFGGLKPATRRKLEEIGETGILPHQLRRDASRLPAGHGAHADLDDVEHRVLVRGPNDFEYQGQRFKSLTAIARHITGTPWSGPAFFGLKTKDGRKEPV